jgi:hypothetical protein
MALVIKPLTGSPKFGPLRGQKARSFLLTADASKPAGGYTVLASALGFTYLDFGVCGAPQVGQGYQPRLLLGTASTDMTVQWYIATQSASNGTLVGQPEGASSTALSTSDVPIYILGR